MFDPLNVARRLARRGLVVIPVPRAGALHKGKTLDGKTPILAWKRYQTERPTDGELVKWFGRHPRNLAILTGYLSGVVVVDVDGAEGLAWALERLPETPWWTKTAKGWHLWYRHPGGLVANRVRLPGDVGDLPVDVRGDGGYVMAPYSLHGSGIWYRAEGDWSQPREALPRFDLDWLPGTFAPSERVTNDKGPSRIRNHSTIEVLKRARAYLAKVPAPQIGHGSDRQTFIAACHLVRGFALSELDAIDLLWEWAGHRPGWDREWITQKVRSASSAHRQEPIGALL